MLIAHVYVLGVIEFRVGKDLRDQLGSNNYIIHQLSELL